MISFLLSLFADFLKLKIGCKPANFQCCRLSGSSFTQKLEKHNYGVIMMSFRIVGTQICIICIFCETEGYQPAKFQISRLSGSNFMEVGRRHKKNTIMKPFHNIGFSKLHIL